MQDQSALRINSNKEVLLSSLIGTGNRLVIANTQGVLSTITTNSLADKIGDHTATENLKMNNNDIKNEKIIIQK